MLCAKICGKRLHRISRRSASTQDDGSKHDLLADDRYPVFVAAVQDLGEAQRGPNRGPNNQMCPAVERIHGATSRAMTTMPLRANCGTWKKPASQRWDHHITSIEAALQRNPTA